MNGVSVEMLNAEVTDRGSGEDEACMVGARSRQASIPLGLSPWLSDPPMGVSRVPLLLSRVTRSTEEAVAEGLAVHEVHTVGQEKPGVQR